MATIETFPPHRLELVGAREIAERLGWAPDTPRTIAGRDPSWPPPVWEGATGTAGRVWDWADIEAYLRRTGRLPGKPGRRYDAQGYDVTSGEGGPRWRKVSRGRGGRRRS